MSNSEQARSQARQNHAVNPQTPMASEQSIQDAAQRNAYNAELDRQRREAEQREQERR